jgi:hypothetical protein
VKDFYRITEISAEFEQWQSTRPLDNPMQEIQLWQAQFLLAIAQQLSMVASHLGKIVRKAEKSDGESRNSD